MTREHAERRQFLYALVVAGSLHALALLATPVARPRPVPMAPEALLFDLQPAAAVQATSARPVAAKAAQSPPAQPTAEPRRPLPSGPEQTAEPSTVVAKPETEIVRREVESTSSHARRRTETLEPDETSSVEPLEQSAPADTPVPADRVAALPVDGAEIAASRARASYEQVLAAWLERHKYYPAVARRRGLEGKGMLRIRIDRRGQVQTRAMEQPIGTRLLDEAAIELVRRAEPFPPMPEGLGGDHFEFVVPIEYRQID
jgi:protein TonB